MKKLFKKQVFKKNDKVRVKNSYYTFSKQYPKGYIKIDRNYKSRRKTKLSKKILLVCAFALLVTASFFIVDLALKISYYPIDDTSNQQTENAAFNKQEFLKSGFKALYMPYTKLGDSEYIEDLIKDIIRKDANSVVIDFKTEDGKLCYTSINEYAIIGKCSIFDNDTVRQALSLFSSANITVAARIVCFKDDAVAGSSPELAVKYMDTDINWLDGSDENGGKAWLNPFSKKSRDYIVSVAKELSNLGINVFILDKVQFPEGDNLSGATFPSESTSSRNKILKTFVRQVSSALPSNAVVFLKQTTSDTLAANETKYSGTMNDAKLDGIAFDTSDRDISFVIDKKSDFSQILSLYSTISSELQSKSVIPIIDIEEYSYSYMRALAKNQYNNFIIYSADGEY